MKVRDMSEPVTSTMATRTETPVVQPEQVAPAGWALSRRDPVVEAIVQAALDPVAPVLDVLTPGGGE